MTCIELANLSADNVTRADCKDLLECPFADEDMFAVVPSNNDQQASTRNVEWNFV
jgi:hypothetical protein